MKRFLAGVIITLGVILIYRSCTEDAMEQQTIREESRLIEKEISQVSKLIVTEGHFAEVYSYEDSRELFGALLSAKKKALVVVNAQASISYDLKQLTYELDPETKTLRIVRIPEPEIAIRPELEYYDVTADYLNPFGAEDYNAIKDRVNNSIEEKILRSGLKENAQNRLLTELAGFFALSRELGWTVVYGDDLSGVLPPPEKLLLD
ncbi:Protein of unknown function [Robiginitalea myxolifaciens]|uniref:DUF4230 domain-containing protein n=1 Tax=Robiginitalea myxolifaciens TaxID=400055 RepID=A0A1I6GD65_9FLAO|nr:DUF4230 domain-containing protein [Robiginitalea myxolifaciens]SFR40027.1 Protein of unknown function [Robiginitalea myxolifaciens]